VVEGHPIETAFLFCAFAKVRMGNSCLEWGWRHLDLQDRTPSRLSTIATPVYRARRQDKAKGEIDRAAVEFTTAVKFDPTDAGAYSNRASIYAAQDKLDLAVADSSNAIELDPLYSDAYRERGSLYEDKGDLAHATADYDRAEKSGVQSLLRPKTPKWVRPRGFSLPRCRSLSREQRTSPTVEN